MGGGHNRGGGRPSADGRQVHWRDRLPQPDTSGSVLNDREGGGADTDGGEVSWMHSNPRLDIEVAVGSGSGQEGNSTDGGKLSKFIPPHLFLQSSMVGNPTVGVWLF